jgi:hypothetical protein
MSTTTTSKATASTLKKVWDFFASSSIVGLMAVFAFVLSVLQWVLPAWQDWRATYAVKGVTPDLVNLYCEGSEGIDTPPGWVPTCRTNSNLTLMATPLSYINETKGNKTVWLRREFVKVTFEDAGRQQYKKPFVLFWERVKSQQDWLPPAVVQLKSGETTSHSTLFYPSHFGCDNGVQWQDCLPINSYSWPNFSDDVINGRIKYVVLDFDPEFIGITSGQFKPVDCELIFDDTHKRKLEALRDHPGPAAYLSASCVERSPAG